MRRILFILMLAVAGTAVSATVSFSKTAVSAKESDPYVELTIGKKGREAAGVRFATVSGTAVPGSEYYATNGILTWAEGDTKARKIRVRLMPDEYPVYEGDKTFGVKLSVLDEEDEEDETEVATPEAIVTVKEVTKEPACAVALAGYYDSDGEWQDFENASKPSLTMLKNGDGGLAGLSFVRAGSTNKAVRVRIKGVSGTAKLGTDFTLGDDPDVKKEETFVEWAAGEAGEKIAWVSAVDDEGTGGVYEKRFSLKLTSEKSGECVKAQVSPASVTVCLNDDCVSESTADFNMRVKSQGLSLSASNWYLSDGGTSLLTKPLSEGAKATCSVSCTGPGFFATYGTSDCGGDFTWKCGSFSGSADGDVALTVPSGKSTISFAYECPEDEDVASLSSMYETETVAPFVWVSFADVRPTPGDCAVVSAETPVALSWDVPEITHDFESSDELHYRVSIAEAQSKLDRSPLLATNVESTAVFVPSGLLEEGRTYYWRVDYLYGEDDSDDLMVAKGKKVWRVTVASADAPAVSILSGTDAYGAPVTNSAVTLHQGVKVDWTLGFDSGSVTKLSCVSGKLPTGLKLAKAKSGLWTISGTPTAGGTYCVTLGGTSGKNSALTLDLVFSVEEIGLAAGTFSCLLTDELGQVSQPSCHSGSLSLQVSEKGKISAKVLLGGKTYSFSDSGFASCELADDTAGEDVTADEADAILTAVMTGTQKIGGVSYVNTLEFSVRDARADNLDALGSALGSATLHLYVPTSDGKSVDGDADGDATEFTGTLYRDDSDEDAVADALGDFVGYYTLALFPETADSPDAPSGNGYLTLTVNAAGTVKVSGKLADGTAVSTSAQGHFVGLLQDWAGEIRHRLVVPLCVSKKGMLFSGELSLERVAGDDAGCALIDADAPFAWVNDSEKAMYDTDAEMWSGFDATLYPAGGWYDKVCNLQTHYRKAALSLEDGDGDADAGVDLVGDKPVVSGSSGVTLKLTRATGLVTGTAVVWDDYLQVSAKATHAGVLIMNSQTDSAEGLWSAGYSLHTRKIGKKSVSVSKAFNVNADAIDPDFSAGDEGEAPGEPIEESE